MDWRTRCRLGLIGTWGSLLPVVASAGSPPSQVQESTNALREARDRLADDGLDGQLFLTLDETVAPLGRGQVGDWVVRGLVDATVTFDADKVLGWRGGLVHVGFQGLVGQSGAQLLGDVQTYDNIDNEPFAATRGAWVQQTLLAGALRIKAGRIEANNEFAAIDENAVTVDVRSRRAFLQSSMGFSPTIARMPSYPLQSLGLVVEARPTSTTRLTLGGFDATHRPSLLSSLPRTSNDPVFSTTSVLAETEQGWRIGPSRASGQIAVGGWLLAGQDACAEPPCSRGHAIGAYAVVSQALWRVRGTDRGVGLFAQYGWAPSYANAIRHHGALGLVWTGIGARRGDMLGAAASWVGIGRPLRSETAIEVFYRVRVDRHVWAQPDVQYVVDPGGRDPDGLALTLRLAFDL